MAWTGDGPQVMPLVNARPGYREWEMTLDGQDFGILHEDGVWTLYQWVQDGWAQEWRAIGSGPVIDVFLKAHNLILGPDGVHQPA
jgi:hypothetical protein